MPLVAFKGERRFLFFWSPCCMTRSTPGRLVTVVGTQHSPHCAHPSSSEENKSSSSFEDIPSILPKAKRAKRLWLHNSLVADAIPHCCSVQSSAFARAAWIAQRSNLTWDLVWIFCTPLFFASFKDRRAVAFLFSPEFFCDRLVQFYIPC